MNQTSALREAALRAAAETHGLRPHQIEHLLALDRRFSLAGRDVLEVGGSLPSAFVLDHVGARSWTAIEELDFYRYSRLNVTATPEATFSSFAALAAVGLGRYQIVTEGVEHLPPALFGHFDAIYSVAAFQHILQFGPAIRAMFEALKPGGTLHAQAAPIWTASQGHMMTIVRDAIGREFSFGSDFVPPRAHLFWRETDFFAEMCKRTDRATAGRLTYEVYHSPRINRLYAEDYFAYLELSPFRTHGSIEVRPTADRLPEQTVRQLEALHPGRRSFEINGLIFDLLRAGPPS